MRNKGFTLAEVLITLGIIGVVAAMTIPILVRTQQKAQYVASLKKAYLQFNLALFNLSSDAGCVNDLKCTGFFDTGTTNKTVGDEIVQYFKVIKNCSTTGNAGCFSHEASTAYDGSAARVNHDNSSYRFITADNMTFAIFNYGTNCSDRNWSSHKTNNLTQVCGYIVVDVNGPNQGPNNYGRDIFDIYITNGKGALLYPFGGIDDAYEGHWLSHCKPSDPRGYWCAARIMESGWEMDY